MELGFLLVLLGAALLPAARAGRTAVLAAVAAGLALAGLRAAPPPLPPGFAAVDAALAALGVALSVGSALAALREPNPRPAPAIGGALVACALIPGALTAGGLGLGWSMRGMFAAAPAGGFLAALLALIAIGLALLLVGRSIHFPAEGAAGAPMPLGAAVGVLAGAVATAVGPQVFLVFAGVILAAWSGCLVRWAAGSLRVPVGAVLTLLLLPAGWLLVTIAGPEGLAIATVPSLPLSPAAERLLAPIFLLAAWGLAGLWPLHRSRPAALLAAVGALLLVRVAIPGVPEGLEHWRPLGMPIILAGIWHAALSRRWTGLAVGLAWIGLLAASREGLIGAALLLAAALALDLEGGMEWRGWRAPLMRILAALAGGTGALLAAEAGLRTEVVYTVLAVGGIVAAVGSVAGGAAPQAITPSARRATAPSG